MIKTSREVVVREWSWRRHKSLRCLCLSDKVLVARGKGRGEGGGGGRGAYGFDSVPFMDRITQLLLGSYTFQYEYTVLPLVSIGAIKGLVKSPCLYDCYTQMLPALKPSSKRLCAGPAG